MKRTIFITGGASGIGFGIAEAMAADGHHIIIADINENAAQQAASAPQAPPQDAQAARVAKSNAALAGDVEKAKKAGRARWLKKQAQMNGDLPTISGAKRKR